LRHCDFLLVQAQHGHLLQLSAGGHLAVQVTVYLPEAGQQLQFVKALLLLLAGAAPPAWLWSHALYWAALSLDAAALQQLCWVHQVSPLQPTAGHLLTPLLQLVLLEVGQGLCQEPAPAVCQSLLGCSLVALV
jgi:hypothetical protein